MKKQKWTYSNVFLAILCGFMVLIPWISRLKLWDLSEEMQNIFYNENGIYLDIFLYYKEIAVILAGVIVIGFFISEILLFKQKRNEMLILKKENRWILLCVAVFVAAVVLSAVFSEDTHTVIWGIPSEGEGVFTLIGYMLLFLGVVNYLREERDWKIFQYALRILMVITIGLTCIEFFYKPLFEIPFFQNMLAGAEYREILESIENESFRNFVTLTFYNPNYFGGFCLLLIPFALKDLLASETNKQRIFSGICLAGMYFCVITAKSTASFYLAILEGILFLAITWLSEKEKRKALLIKLGVFAVSFGVILLTAFALNGERLAKVTSSAVKNERWQELGIAKYELSDIQIEENKLIFYIGDKVLTVASENGAVMFHDTAGNLISINAYNSEDAVILELQGEEFTGVTVEITGNLFAFDFGYEGLVYFEVIEDEFYGIGQNGQLFKTVSLGPMSERFGTEFYGLITGRGYAWIHTLPILKDTLFIGKGAGNFPLYFPQYDYVGLLNTHGNHELVADKPHCMYLQVAVDQGMVGLLSLLILFAGVGIGYIKVRLKLSEFNERTRMMDASFTVLVAFLIYSGCNDSNVAVNSVFWAVFGTLVTNLLYFSQKKVVFKN